MNLKIALSAAQLTAPSISPQHPFVQGSVRKSIKPQPRSFGADRVHEVIRALSTTPRRLGKSRSKKVVREQNCWCPDLHPRENQHKSSLECSPAIYRFPTSNQLFQAL